MPAANRIPRPVLRSALLEKFSCLGPTCADNCCQTWAAKVDAPTLALYQQEAPELLDIIEIREGVGPALKFDAVTGCCPKLEQGSCTIHAMRGTDFLTDTCHLYPRITRELGDQTIVTATLSCPEIARLTLFETHLLTLAPSIADRVPEAIKNYLPEGEAAPALALCADAQHGITDPEQRLNALAVEAYVLSNAPVNQWPQLHEKIKPSLSSALPEPVSHPHDALFMLIMLTTLVTACKIKPSARLKEVISLMEQALNVQLLWDEATANMQPDTLQRLQALEQRYAEHYEPTLKPLLARVLEAQLAAALYPYAGLGNTPSERITWVAYEYALIRLALMCAADQIGGKPQESLIIQVVQTITRVLDHVGNLELAMPMLKEIGWLEPARLAGLLQLNKI